MNLEPELEPVDRPDALEDDLVDVVESLRPRLKVLFRSFRLSWEDAEDVLQKALLAAVIASRAQRPVRDLEAWLLVTARNRCIIHVRNLRRWKAVESELARIPARKPGGDDLLERLVLSLDLRRNARGLATSQRLVLALRLRGYSYSEIASMLHYEPDSPRRIVFRLRGRLAQGDGSARLGGQSKGVVAKRPKPGGSGFGRGRRPAPRGRE